jgi:hypothetical protein
LIRYLPLVVAAALVAAAGVVHGLRTDRWGAPPDVGAAAARLDAVSNALGDWEGRPMEMDARQLVVAEAAGHLARRYLNRRTNAEVSVVVLCGRPGPIAVHSPEICYPGAGFVRDGDRQTRSLPGDDGARASQLFAARFTKTGTPPETLAVFWGWGTDGAWSASADARVEFARAPYLYKLYVIRRLPRADDPGAEEPTKDLLRVLLPELEKRLSPTP